jgi:hypothetical protein
MVKEERLVRPFQSIPLLTEFAYTKNWRNFVVPFITEPYRYARLSETYC